jgi:hypothetical protein
MPAAALFLALLLMAEPPVGVDRPANDCDRMAANPEDPDVLAPGTPRARIDLPKAIAACEAAVKADPNDPRMRYQLARVLAYGDQTARGAAEMKRSADQGYRQAQFVYGLQIDRKRPGVPTDMCIAEAYWLKSARADRLAAQVSYVRHVTDGHFKSCKLGADKAEMGRFLDVAEKVGDYYQRMLAEELREDLAKLP